MAAPGTSRLDTLIKRGLAAATATAREQGLPADDPRVLSARGNLLVHLAPAPVVARVATLTAFTRRDPFAWLAREVSVADFAARRAGPVVAPAGIADPGPHWSDGLALSLWTYLPRADQRPGPAQAGQALAMLHQSLAGYPAELPWLLPATDQISQALTALDREHVVDAAILAALRARHAAVLAGLASHDLASHDLASTNPASTGGPAIVLHGDAQPGNLLRAGTGWLWIDLEETCRGPREWDLAVLARGAASGEPGDSGIALAAYAATAGTAIPGPEELAPFTRARELEAAVWSLGMAHQFPARYRDVARDLLARILDGS